MEGYCFLPDETLSDASKLFFFQVLYEVIARTDRTDRIRKTGKLTERQTERQTNRATEKDRMTGTDRMTV